MRTFVLLATMMCGVTANAQVLIKLSDLSEAKQAELKKAGYTDFYVVMSPVSAVSNVSAVPNPPAVQGVTKADCKCQCGPNCRCQKCPCAPGCPCCGKCGPDCRCWGRCGPDCPCWGVNNSYRQIVCPCRGVFRRR